MNGGRKPLDVQIPVAESKVTADSGTMSGPLVAQGARAAALAQRRADVVHAALRFLCLTTSVVSLSAMAVAEQSSSIVIYGFSLPVYAKWSFSDSFEYLVGMCAAVAAHSLLQLLLSASRMAKRSPVIPSRSHAWLMFAGDQAFAYAMMSAGSASAGVTNLNRTGIRHAPLPDFCKPLNVFCSRAAVSIAFAFFTCFLLAGSALLDVIWLSKY
ncbi:CASP-like protein 3A1 [Nymphaea colorata]|nr:CASP-like protein 3A1 [Nymphaea colorata]